VIAGSTPPIENVKIPRMLNSIRSAAAVALADVMAWWREPGPLALVFVTVKVAACAAPALAQEATSPSATRRTADRQESGRRLAELACAS
jgi:hypothetical protein